MEPNTDSMTHLEFCDHYIVKCQRFVNPGLLSEASKRGLMQFLNYLPGDIDEAKSILRARMAKAGKFFGDDEIDKIAGEIDRLEDLRTELNKLNLANAHEVLPVLNKMLGHSVFIKDYFKPIKFP